MGEENEEIAQLQNKAQQIIGICKAAIGYRKKVRKTMLKDKESKLAK